MTSRRVLVTGGSGYLGRQVVEALARLPACEAVVSLDLRSPAPEQHRHGVAYESCDIRDTALADVFRKHGVSVVVHLAAIVTPGGKSNRHFEYQVDVLGTRNVLEACIAANVSQVVISSSGAAYGYHADNPAWLTETDALRGNHEFAYSWHKRLVEEMLAEYRERAPQLAQTVLRIGTILGESVNNQITALFEKPRLLAVAGSDSPFVFAWDQDVVGAILHAVETGRAGIFNVAGDGALTIHEIAARLGKRCRVLPPWLLSAGLWLGHSLGLTRYGPEQLRFLQYRPVLDNRRLKEEFGYVPRKTSVETLDFWWAARSAANKGTR